MNSWFKQEYQWRTEKASAFRQMGSSRKFVTRLSENSCEILSGND